MRHIPLPRPCSARSVAPCAAFISLIVAGICLLLASPRPASAGSPVPTPDSAESAIGSTANTSTSDRDVPPTAAEIAVLRERVDHHVVRVRLGQDLYDIRGARFDSAGVAFDRGGLRVLTSGTYDEPRPPLPSSPIGWDRIDRITVQKACGTRGAVVGGVAGLGAMIALAAYANAATHGHVGPAVLIVYTLPPIGAVTGGAMGAFISRSEPGWQRTGAAREAPIGTTVPTTESPGGASAISPGIPTAATQAPLSLPLGVLRDDIGRHAIRIRVGPDRYEIRDARLEPSGIAFDAGKLRRLSPRAPAGTDGEGARLSPASSPIGWDRIDRIEARVPSALRGAVFGMTLVPVALLLLAGDDISYFGALGAVVVGAPTGALLGAGAGAFVRHSKLEWDRFASASEAR